MRTECEREVADRIRPPLAWLGPRDVLDADPRLGVIRAVLRSQGEDDPRRLAAGVDPLRLGRGVRDRVQVIGEDLIAMGAL